MNNTNSKTIGIINIRLFITNAEYQGNEVVISLAILIQSITVFIKKNPKVPINKTNKILTKIFNLPFSISFNHYYDKSNNN